MYVYKRKVWNAHHHIQLDIRNFLLTSILLSSDPALLRRPRLPAQDMQQQRLETATRPAPGVRPHSPTASGPAGPAAPCTACGSGGTGNLERCCWCWGSAHTSGVWCCWQFAQFLSRRVWAAGFSAVLVMLSSKDFKGFGFLEADWPWRFFLLWTLRYSCGVALT